MKGRLNLFQTSMLRWREMHPYNAVHLIRVPQPLDRDRLRQTIARHLEALGLTGLVLDHERRQFEYTGGAAPDDELPVIAANGDALSAISREIERQLNLPFPRSGRLDPFRFFAVDSGASFHVGVSYDHFVGAGDSTVVLLKGLWERYTGNAPETSQAPERYPARFRQLVFQHPLRVAAGLRRLREMPASCRRGFRPRYPGAPDTSNAFTCVRFEAPHVERFVRTAKAWQVTPNDLMIAMLMQALSPLAENRRGEQRRNELAVASIVNLRREFGYASDSAFGQFLSSFRVSHPVPQDIGLRELAQDVRKQTVTVRSEGRYFQSLLAMQMSGALWPFLTPERRANFHCKNYPVWAGTTPLNVDAIWKETGGGAPVPEYLRGVSTGPLTPLVVAATTAGGPMHLGATYRRAAFSRENVDKILVHITRCLHNLPP